MYKALLSLSLTASYLLASSPAQPIQTQTTQTVPPMEVQAEYSAWKSQFSLYGWLAIPNATVTFNVPESNDDVESDIADKLDGLFMGNYRIQNDKYSFMIDAIYVGFANSNDKSIALSNSALDLSADTSLDAFLGTGYVGYNLMNDGQSRLDLIGGIRYTSIEVGIKLSATSAAQYRSLDLSKTLDLVDGVIGVDGTYQLNPEWYIPYHLDIGAGDSDLTVHASTGVGYQFDWGDVLLTYRYLSYDFEDSKIMKDIAFSGPLLGVNFRF